MTDQIKMTDKYRDTIADPAHDGRPSIVQTSQSGSGWIAAIVVLAFLAIAAWYVSSSRDLTDPNPVTTTNEAPLETPAAPSAENPSMQTAPETATPPAATPPAADPAIESAPSTPAAPAAPPAANP
jgi:cytoskeletal protein RodZ